MAVIFALRWNPIPLLAVLALENYFAFRLDWRSLPWVVTWNQIKGSITKTNQPNRQNA